MVVLRVPGLASGQQFFRVGDSALQKYARCTGEIGV